MEFEVEIGVTYKYIISKTVKESSETEARNKVIKSLKTATQRQLENEWNWGDEPSFVGDFEILEIEEI